jgi:hypothetical protein
LASGSHQVAHGGLDISDVIVIVSLSVIVKDVKSNVLARLKDEIDDKSFGKVGVEVVLDGFCSA